MGLLDERPQRMAREWRLIQDHAKSGAGFSVQRWEVDEAGQVCAHFRLDLVPPMTRDGVLVYPPLFPDVAAYIRPARPREVWSGTHQYGGSGILCLEYGPDNWHVGITGLDLIKSATKLIWTEVMQVLTLHAPPIPSRHALTAGQEVRFQRFRLVATKDLRLALSEAAKDSIELTCKVSYLEACSVVVIKTLAGEPKRDIRDVPASLHEEGLDREGWALRVEDTAAFDSVKDVSSLKAQLGERWPWGGSSVLMRLLVLHDRLGGIRAFGVAEDTTPPLFQRYHLLEFSEDKATRLPPNFEALKDVKVAVVGLGSLGSKIAISLARAGVGSFVLADDDILTPQNLVRNELNWHDVGYEKADAVAREIKLVAAGSVSVEAMCARVCGQENPLVSAVVAEALASCNLVIDATAAPSAFLTLAALCHRAQIAMVWGEVFAGGGGGLMARSRPGLDPDPLSVRNHIFGVLRDAPPAPGTEQRDYGADIDGRVYIASDAEVGALAAHMTQFSLDALCKEAESAYPVAAYLIGFRKFWLFDQPFDVRPVDCSAAVQPEHPAVELTAQEQADLQDMKRQVEVRGSASNNGTA